MSSRSSSCDFAIVVLGASAFALLTGCLLGADLGQEPTLSGGTGTDTAPAPTSSPTSTSPPTHGGTSDSTTTAPQPSTGAAQPDTGAGPLLDVAPPDPTATTGEPAGCTKVDFLFIVDNSGSMLDEQDALVATFPGFIATIQATLQEASDYHIMVVDTDARPAFVNLTCFQGVCTCEPEPQCCYGMCATEITPPITECVGVSCDEWQFPEGCAVQLGAGKAENDVFEPCGIEDDRRFMTATQPDLETTFSCVARVGSGGDGAERPMDAMLQALTVETEVGGCQEGFLRDDAILVVAFITDEEDTNSVGNPATWKQGLVGIKNDDENAVVVLGLLGDPEVAGSPCTGGEAFDAPLLREFVESFPRGSWASVCEADYDSFFEAAVGDIDTTCREFDPAG